MSAEIRVDGLDGEVLIATVWSAAGADTYFQLALYRDAESADSGDELPVCSIEIPAADAMRLAMGLAGTAMRCGVTADHIHPTCEIKE